MRSRREAAERLWRTGPLRRRLGAILAGFAAVLWISAGFLPTRECWVAIVLGGAVATGAIALFASSV